MARKKRSVARRLADRNAQLRDAHAQMDTLRSALADRQYFVSASFLQDCRSCLVALTKNAAHCYGIDFRALNDSLITLDSLLPKEGA